MATDDTQLDHYDLAEKLRATGRKLEGTRSNHFMDSKSLCVTCKHATLFRQSSKNHRRINCSIIGKNVPDDIVECSDHMNITSLSLVQMADLAILLNDRAGRQGGYL